jgi:hypothetical protein
VQRRCDRNRNRSKRRAIYCPIHGCYLDSVSPKYPLFAERPGQLQQRGIPRRQALMLVAAKTAIPLGGEWLEAFWCQHCQEKKWYHVRKHKSSYEISVAPIELWQQATGVLHPHLSPAISEFTIRHSRMTNNKSLKDFRVIT